MTAGGAVGDFNNDGWQDLFVIDGGTGPDHLFINNGDGTFTDDAAAWGLVDVHWGSGAAVGDYNDDGWSDIFVTSFGDAAGMRPGAHRLYRNNGHGSFSEVAADAGVNTSGPDDADGFGGAFGDYDLDGDLDLYVTGWRYGVDNRLFRNNGDETFSDVTVEAGLYTETLYGFSPRFVDMDGDRYPELLVSADFGSSRYYVNRRDGTFTDFTMPSGTGLDGNGMGSTIGDVNRDGLLDWYVSSIWTHVEHPSIPGTGNMLYLNQGDHIFLEAAQLAGVHDGGWGWGTVAVDLDHDGRLDLAETNGWEMHGDDDFTTERAKLFLQADGAFVESAETSGFTHVAQGRGLVRFDYDNDGDQDLVVMSHGAPLELYRNELCPCSGWLRVFLETSQNPWIPPNGYGAVVRATVRGQTWVSYVGADQSYLSQSEMSAHFGVGNAESSGSVTVEWPNGAVTHLADVATDQTITVSAPRPSDLNGDGVVDLLDVLLLRARWGACPEAPEPCLADLNRDGVVDIRDLLALLRDRDV